MRILSLAPTSFFGDYGCHVRILEEARALQQLGHTVTLLTYYKGNDVPDLPDLRILRTAPTPWRSNYEVGSSRHKYVFDGLLAAKLLAVLMRERFDVIHAHLHDGALIASLVGRLWRIPVCFDYQGSLTDDMVQHGFVRRDWSHRISSRLEQAINRRPAAIFTSTLNAANALRAELGEGWPVQHLPDGVNSDVVRREVLTPQQRAEGRARYGIAPHEPVAVFLGLLARHQGIANIVDAAAILKQQGHAMRWLVMGYPNVSQWQHYAAQRGVAHEVVFTGRVPYPEMPRMLALGDVAVAPKLSLTEGSGKLLNYMAMELPTVAFDTPAQREILGGVGVYVPMGDSAALAHEVWQLVQQPDRARQLGQRARLRARQLFGWDRAATLMVKMYQTVLGLNARTLVEQREVS